MPGFNKRQFFNQNNFLTGFFKRECFIFYVLCFKLEVQYKNEIAGKRIREIPGVGEISQFIIWLVFVADITRALIG